MSSSGRAAFAAALLVGISPCAVFAQRSPIEHVIVIVGENHTFDNVFGGYIPSPGQTVLNLLSQDIIDDNGKPGRNFSLARQRMAKDDPKNPLYTIDPMRNGPYLKLPQPIPPTPPVSPRMSRIPAFPTTCPTARSRSRAMRPIAISSATRCTAFQMWQ